MVDGGFREHTYGAEYFSKQDFPDDEFEVIWVEFYSNVPESVKQFNKVKVITLNHSTDVEYHSSLCFNKGIESAKGELIIIPDADQIVKEDFLSKMWKTHSEYEKLVVYAYRYDEINAGELKSFEWEELEKKCILKNPKNYGGCLSVRKKWLMEINGYEQHLFFSSGFHANGLDIYTRFKNLGLAIMWSTDVKLFHPWHPNTLVVADQYKVQHEFIEWRFRNVQFRAINGIDPKMNYNSFDEKSFLEKFNSKSKSKKETVQENQGFISRIFKKEK